MRRAELLVDQFKKKAALYRTRALLVPHGDDFRFSDAREVHLQFDNLMFLFDYINSHPEFNTQVCSLRSRHVKRIFGEKLIN